MQISDNCNNSFTISTKWLIAGKDIGIKIRRFEGKEESKKSEIGFDWLLGATMKVPKPEK